MRSKEVGSAFRRMETAKEEERQKERDEELRKEFRKMQHLKKLQMQ